MSSFTSGFAMGEPPALIAIVDDEESIRKALRRLMRSAGFTVETFLSGAEFLESLSTRAPRCVVLDLHMPQVDGFEVQKRIALRRPEIPVIIITGHDTPDSCTRVMKQGARAYLRKPVDDTTLLDAIGAALHRA